MAREIRIIKRIEASPEEVFDAWGDAENLELWMKPGTEHRSRADIDFRVGGRFKIDMVHGEKVYPHEGEYLRLERPHLLEFTWQSLATKHQRSVVTIEIQREGNGCTLTLTHRLLPDDAADDHRKGWTEILDQLAASRFRES